MLSRFPVRHLRHARQQTSALPSLLAAILLLAMLSGCAHGSSSSRVAEWMRLDPALLQLQSASALVVDERGNLIYARNPRRVQPIASITKLMTAIIVLDAGVPLDTPIRIIEADRDRLRNSRSRLLIGEAELPRGEMLRLALMSSDNRAASALARTTFPGGTPAFVAAMNRKARELGMLDTHFADSSGLNGDNRSHAEDLVKLIEAAARYPYIRELSTTGEHLAYPVAGQPPLTYRNTNPLVRNPAWDVEISKTGYINESGHCLVMQTRVEGVRLRMVFLNAVGRLTPVGDANRLRTWLTGATQTTAAR